MADNIPKNEYEQKQRQNYLIDMTRRRKVAEADTQEEEEDTPEYYADNVSYLPEEGSGLATQNQVQKQQRIKIWMAWLLITAAIFLDIVEIILEWLGIGLLGVNALITICASTVFWIWFLSLGVTYSSNTKKFGTAFIQGVLEIIPGQDATIILSFAWTIGMILIVGMTRMEDKGEEPSISGGLLEGLGVFTSNPLFIVGNLPMIAASAGLKAINGSRRKIKGVQNSKETNG